MTIADRASQYVRDYPEGPFAGDFIAYVQGIFDLLIALDPEITEVNGFACMRILEAAEIYLTDGRMIPSDPLYGTFGDMAEAIAVVFAPVEARPIVWKANYSSVMANPEVVEASTQLLRAIEPLPMVERVDRGWLK